jgi:hypothetical protein
MIRDEYEHLIAERGTLERLLADIPEEQVLTRGSFLARLEDVQEQIASAQGRVWNPARASLTFRGRPVVGGHGVFADFGVEATSKFVLAVTTLAASQSSPLGAAGPIPNRSQHRLLITGTAVGSFGFELEEYREPVAEQLPLGLEAETTVALALAQAQDLLVRALGAGDDELADAVVGIDRRARNAVRDFLETVAAGEATFALVTDSAAVTFPGVSDVRRAIQRLGQDNLHEALETFEGAFQGVLPKCRTFEFTLADSAEVLTGKIGPGISDPNVLNGHLQESVQIRVVSVRVGAGRPRYMLDELPVWSGADDIVRP